jgi:HK97 gp10 family phage protein
MANKVTVKVSGLEELEEKLYDMPSKFARQAMRKALRPAADVWKDEIAARAPEKTGWLKSQAAVSIKLSAKEESGTALVGFTKKQNPALIGKEKHVPSAANEAFWYEMGTRHQPARPFIRPAFDALKSTVLDTFITKLKEAFSEVFGK